MYFGLHGLKYESLELVVQLELHPGLAETRGAQQLGTRVSNQRTFEENTQTNSFNEGSLIHSTPFNVILRSATSDCTMRTIDEQTHQQFVKSIRSLIRIFLLYFNSICNVNEGCGIVRLGGKRGGALFKLIKKCDHQKRYNSHLRPEPILQPSRQPSWSVP